MERATEQYRIAYDDLLKALVEFTEMVKAQSTPENVIAASDVLAGYTNELQEEYMGGALNSEDDLDEREMVSDVGLDTSSDSDDDDFIVTEVLEVLDDTDPEEDLLSDDECVTEITSQD